MFLPTSVHVLPPDVLTHSWPSSVPAHSTPAFTGDSASDRMLCPLLLTGRPAAAAVVLEAAVDAVRRPHVHRDAVELAEGEAALRRERLRPVLRDVQPAVAAEDQVVRVLRVDPQSVVVGVHPLAVRVRAE